MLVVGVALAGLHHHQHRAAGRAVLARGSRDRVGDAAARVVQRQPRQLGRGPRRALQQVRVQLADQRAQAAERRRDGIELHLRTRHLPYEATLTLPNQLEL